MTASAPEAALLTLRYSCSLDDYIIWLERYYWQSVAMKRVFLIHRLSYASMFGAFGVLAASIDQWLIGAVMLVAAAAAWAVVPRSVVKRALRYARTMLHEDEEPFGPAELTLFADALTLSNSRLQIRFKLSTIQRIDNDSSATYLHYSSLGAVIIPWRKISMGNVEEFVRALESFRSKASAG